MLTILFDHQSFAAARRTLIISSIATLVIASSQISGEFVEFLGLQVKFSQFNLLIISKMLTAYFSWVFFWAGLSEYSEKVLPILVTHFQHHIESSLNAAKEVDDEVYRRQDEERGPEDIDSWWRAHYERKEKLENSIAATRRTTQMLKIGKAAFVDFLPPFIVAVSALSCPHWIVNHFLAGP